METKKVTVKKKKISPKFSSIKVSAPVNIERAKDGALIVPWCC